MSLKTINMFVDNELEAEVVSIMANKVIDFSIQYHDCINYLIVKKGKSQDEATEMVNQAVNKLSDQVSESIKELEKRKVSG